MLKKLIEHEYIKEGDAVMADKGFTIADELREIGLKLNIPPFSSCNQQMSNADNHATNKIAKHRIHIERLIAKVKRFRIVSYPIPTILFPKINKIWTVCSSMTLFQKLFVTDKKRK